MACALSSCAIHRDQWKDEVQVPSHWKSQKHSDNPLNAASIRQWWKRFNDPVLDALIVQGLAASPDIKTALSRITESRGERSVVLSGLLPSVTGRASNHIERKDEQSTGLVTRSQTSNLSLDMSWEIDLFGRQLQNLAASTKDVQQTVENYYAAQVTLTADIAAAYITLRGAQARLEVLQHNVKTRSETTQITRWKQEAGISDMLEVQQAVSTLDQARATIPTNEQTIS